MIYLGTSGWSYDHWIERFYPEKLERKEWLPYYSKSFNTVEVNMTFYRFPFRNMLKGWYNKTPKNFKFTLKANRQITHIKKLKNVKFLLNKFYSLADLLKEKLACILFQTPPGLKKDKTLLKNFLENLNKKYNNVIEFRHKSWYCDEIYELLKKYNTAFCIVSGLKMPPDIKVTSSTAYLRFHGPGSAYSSNYNKKELKDYATKIKKLKFKNLYAYFNNDYNAYAVENCLTLKKLLK